MKVLALDTATEACSAAVYVDGNIQEVFKVAPQEHSRLILSMIEQVLAQSGVQAGQLDGVAFGRGPGSFTGLRIAAGVAQGLALAWDLPVVPVSNLAALAQAMNREYNETRVFCAMDARRDEVYWSACELRGAGFHWEGEEHLSAPQDVIVPPKGTWAAAGNGWERYGQAWAQQLRGRLSGQTAPRHPRGWDIALLGAAALGLGKGVAPERALPVYLRDNVVEPPR